jgi:GntR family transcriptional regulator
MFAIDASDPMPIYAQLERAIRSAVVAGVLSAGDQLPTVRQLAVDLRVNANTVARVYAELERSGMVETRRGVGTFVIAGERHASKGRNRPRELDRIVERFLADASRHGFTIDELIETLNDRKHLK